jgi:hypothetical protein
LLKPAFFIFLYFNIQDNVSTVDLNPVGIKWLKGTFYEIYFIDLILHYLVFIEQEKYKNMITTFIN